MPKFSSKYIRLAATLKTVSIWQQSDIWKKETKRQMWPAENTEQVQIWVNTTNKSFLKRLSLILMTIPPQKKYTGSWVWSVQWWAFLNTVTRVRNFFSWVTVRFSQMTMHHWVCQLVIWNEGHLQDWFLTYSMYYKSKCSCIWIFKKKVFNLTSRSDCGIDSSSLTKVFRALSRASSP